MSAESKSVRDFRANVQWYMDLREMNQGELADAASLSRIYVNRLLQGHQVPRIDVLEQIATALDVPSMLLLAEPKKNLSVAS